MADTSPGKVQALKAIFSEKNNPVMGLMPPGTKLPSRPCPRLNGRVQDTPLKGDTFGSLHRVMPADNKPIPRPTATKPVVGPKPPHLVQRRSPSSMTEAPHATTNQRAEPGSAPDARSKVFAETIASFMFSKSREDAVASKNSSCVIEDGSVNEDSRTVKDSGMNEDSPPPPLPPSAPKPRISQMRAHEDISAAKSDTRSCSFISSNNYICKVRRKELPSKEKLGPAPLKPIKPRHLKLPHGMTSLTSNSDAAAVRTQTTLQRPSYPCPPRPVTSPPLPPPSVPVIKRVQPSLREEIEELYEDTLLDNKRPVSLIPEYTAEEEESELYNDAVEEDFSLKSKKPPPPFPSEYLQPNINGSVEELYQDADGNMQDEFYEVMPCDETPEDAGSPLYSNNKREIEKLKKEEEKRIRREQKEKEKREKELEKLKKRFGLTGEEIPIDDGLVKWDSRGGKGDLPVKKGETVLILRMEGNPSGRWLVKNEKGKIGYVELTNIEVDPLSVKSVMSVQRLSVISAGEEELYCEAKSEEEAIYEVTY